MTETDYDVIVVGAGPAGSCAAIQAGRLGARTLLIEKNGMLGGTTTVAAVDFPGLFHAWGKQVISGIGWDLVCEAVELAGDQLPDFTEFRQPHWRLQIRVNRALYASVLDNGVLTSGADLLLHTMVAGVARNSEGWRVTVCGKEGLRDFRCRSLVDCTGDADVVAAAGHDRLRNERLQPGTIMTSLGGYDPDHLDYTALDSAYHVAVDRGDLRPEDLGQTYDPVRSFLRKRGENAIHVTQVDGSTSAGRTAAEVAGRQALMRIYRFLRTQEGLESLRINYLANECGIRETYTIDGHERVTAQDYLGGRLWDDAISYSYYPIDVHRPNGDGVDKTMLTEGIVPTIPRGAMVPRDSTFLLAAGRCVSGDQEATSAFRVQASCMAMGQAAGAMAGMSADRNVDVIDLPIDDVRTVLRQHGAIVPPDLNAQAS